MHLNKNGGNDLANFSSAIRKTTLKRLEEVPSTFINWRLNNTAMSFAHIVKHLIHVDDLLFNLAASEETLFQWKFGTDDPHHFVTLADYEAMLAQLQVYQQKRHALISNFSPEKMNQEVTDENGNKMTFWWFIMRKVLEHETYHRGQIAAYLKVLKGEA
ncbi:DinB family protein [Winogradskyella aurantia]|uniref:DinB-like domain-containing protein n=1 Tax=Winogradskyella aurantia TaxID=1915063 RepID=A0A265UWX5_9FLAO|nr:DinB family protein [Winogradskyella aurantia]OZV69810.1 hypothetical protein CA834_04090 [Winogradskyella aurantia]